MISNSKEVKNRIKEYIFENIDLSEQGLPNSFASLFAIYKLENRIEYSDIKVIKQWVMSGISEIKFPLDYHDIIEVMIKQFGLPPRPAKYSKMDSADLFYHLISRECHRMFQIEEKK